MHSLVLLCPLTMICNTSFVRATPATQSVVLRYHWVVGQKATIRYSDTYQSTFTSQTKDASQNGTDHESVQYLTHGETTKVFTDGSALRRYTFTAVNVVKDGRKQTYDLPKYALIQRVGPTGTLISTQVEGKPTNVGELPTGLTERPPLSYPSSPVSIGSTWKQTQRTEMGTITLTLQLKALGTVNGRPTATIHGSMQQQPVALTSHGVRIAGTVTTESTAQIFIDTGMLAAPVTIHDGFQGTMSGRVDVLATPIQGTLVTRRDIHETPINPL